MFRFRKNKPPRSFLRRTITRVMRAIGITILIAAIAAWYLVFRIVEEDHWPPPADAVTAAQAQAATEAFARRNDPKRDDVAIPYAPTTAADVQLYVEGKTFFPAIIDDINAAESSVHVMMFGFYPGEWGTKIADALTAKADEGVEVRVSVDRYGSKVFTENSDLYKEVSSSGVEVVVNDIFPMQAEGELPNRDRSWIQDEVGQADHRKVIVIDGKVGWIGGAGFEDHFANGGYHDVFVRVTGNVVSQMQAVYLTSFYAYGGVVPGEPGSLARVLP